MSLLDNAKQEAARIADDISKNGNGIASQLRDLDRMQNEISAIMGSSASGADKRVLALLHEAAQKGGTAQAKLREASSRMKHWASTSG